MEILEFVKVIIMPSLLGSAMYMRKNSENPNALIPQVTINALASLGVTQRPINNLKTVMDWKQSK
jgi:hypothetical protein